MKTAKTFAAALACLALPMLASAATLTVTIDQIETTEGTIRLGVFDAAGYEAGTPVSGVNITVDGATVTANIEGLSPGEYGIKLYHDVNNDEEMNSNPFGMPTEPYAFSNDAKGRFGPAKWDAAKFNVSEDGAAQTINLQ